MGHEDRLQLLLIEDNPGDARLITEMLRDAQELFDRVHWSDEPPTKPEIHHERRLSAGLERLGSTDVDVVLLDLHLPDSSGIETLAEVVEATESVPVVVLTGMNDRRLGVEAIQHGAQEYLVKGEVTSELLVRSLHHAIERKQQDLARTRHQQHLQTLNRLHTIVSDVSHAAIQTTSREELERRVCERLVESETYELAWIGEVERGGNHVVPRVAVGSDEGYVEEIAITIDGESSRGPTGEAMLTQQMCVTEDVRTDPSYEAWREEAERRGYRSSAAIPLVYDGMLYGVLNVYATEPNAFSRPGSEMLGDLGEIIGHAISAIERKEALISDSVYELEFRIAGIAEPLVSFTASHEGSIRATRVIQTDDDTLLIYGSVSELPTEQFREAASRIEWMNHVRLIGPRYERTFEASISRELPFLDALASYGGKFESITVADGELRVIAELPRGRDTRGLLENVRAVCPGAELLAQRHTTRHVDTASTHQSVFEDRLTEKQRTALESAYFSGYFDTPRASSGEEIAATLDVAPTTFFQHLRKAQKKLFGALFEA